TCPVVDATTPRFCESIGTGNNFHKPMVSDLDPSGATWYATADSTDPLAGSTLLENGGSYFAGNADGTCDNRTEVSVEIFPAPNAGSTTQVSFCSNEPAVNLVDYMDESILGPAQQTGYYTPALENNMFDPANYAAGSYRFTYTVPGNSDCPTDKAVITVTVKQAPDAGESSSVQLNEGDTQTIDLFAELGGNPQTDGTWDTGNGTFDPATDTPGVFTYTVTSSNACTASATVTVLAPQQDCPTVTNTTQEFCESIGTGNNFHKPMISDLEPADATWYATADSTDPLPASTILVDGENYFAGVADGTCTSRSEVTVTISDAPNAGKTTFITVCSNDEPFDLAERMEPSILGAADAGGTFSPALASGTTEFNPAVDAGRRYTYTVKSTGSCPSDSAYITVTVNEAPDAGEDINEDFCVDSVDEIISNPQDFLDLYAGDRDAGGTFNPTLDQLAADFSANPYGTFSTTYTVGGNGCTDSATLSITITQRVAANAGDDINVTFCSTEGVQDLYEYLPENANTGGSFASPYEDGNFDPANAGTDSIDITYTVDEAQACVTGSDSSIMTVTVVPGPDAGEDGSITLNVNDDPVNLFNSLGGTPDAGGTWTPGAADGTLDPSSLSTGTYNYTYTVASDNGCDDSAVVAVTIEGETVVCPEITETQQTFCESIGTGNDYHKPTVGDLAPANAVWYASADADTALPSDTLLEDGVTYFAGNANGTCTAREMVTVTIDNSPNAGATTAVTLCENGDAVDLVSLMNPSILGDADAGGTFTPALASGNTMFDPGVDAAGRYTYRVVSEEGSCPDDIAIITVTITPSANAGEDMEFDLCTNQGTVSLSEYLSANADTTGEFTMDGNVIAGGNLDPATLTADDYTVEYNVEAANDCGSDSATLTIHVYDAPTAPDASDLEFCAVNAPTGADLTPSGEGFTWYSDAALENMVAADDALENGDYYVTSTNGDCESDATMINVTINDPDAPSIDENALDLCEFEDNTIADLNAAINENAEITWYASEDGTTALSTATVLEDGVTYYATLRDSGTGCESARRLAYTVHLKECDLVFPEGISPNNDGRNDEFVIKKIGEKYPNYTIEIYNRWGNMVYKGNASTPEWDGSSNQSGTLGNDILPVGIYFYVVEFNDGETPAKQGKIYLSR
ncbi:MAG: gliding motility-associated C-terminal domain-containing protein, partial [Salegentibacter sp.]